MLPEQVRNRDPTFSLTDHTHDLGVSKATTHHHYAEKILIQKLLFLWGITGHEVWKYAFTKTKEDGTNFIPYYDMFSSGSNGSEKQLSIILTGIRSGIIHCRIPQ